MKTKHNPPSTAHRPLFTIHRSPFTSHRAFGAFSLIEILIVVGLFAVLSVLTTVAISSSLTGSRKSQAISNVRAELDHVTQIMTRQLRNASAIYGDCDGSPQSNIAFYDQIGTLTQFSCQGLETDDGFIASSTANIRVTSPKVNIVTCEFTCQPGAVGGTDSILMVVSGVDTENAGIESARVDLQTQVNLRNY